MCLTKILWRPAVPARITVARIPIPRVRVPGRTPARITLRGAGTVAMRLSLWIPLLLSLWITITIAVAVAVAVAIPGPTATATALRRPRPLNFIRRPLEAAQLLSQRLDVAFIGRLLALGFLEDLEHFIHLIERLLQGGDDFHHIVDGLADGLGRGGLKGSARQVGLGLGLGMRVRMDGPGRGAFLAEGSRGGRRTIPIRLARRGLIGNLHFGVGGKEALVPRGVTLGSRAGVSVFGRRFRGGFKVAFFRRHGMWSGRSRSRIATSPPTATAAA